MGFETALSVGVPIVSGLLQNNAARSAASQQADAASRAAELQQAQYNQTRADQEPFRLTGVEANKRLAELLRPGGDLSRRFNETDLANDPVYNSGLKFGLDQGTGAINARALQGGGYDSGATLKALTRYANDYGSTKANESYNRFNTDMTNLYNRNAGISGAGQQATNQVQAAGTQNAMAQGEYGTQAANARAAGVVGEANAWGGALSGLNNAYQQNENRNLLKTWLST